MERVNFEIAVMRYLVLTYLLFFSIPSWSQSRVIEGTVYSGAYLKPLNKVHVRSGRNSTKTDRNGKFRLELEDWEPLKISHVQYDIQEISAGRVQKLKAFSFYLTPSATSTSMVIPENESQEVYAAEFEHVSDYIFDADTLLILSYMHEENMKKRRYVNCAITGLKYGEVFQRLVVPHNIRGVKGHPSGEVYLAGPESVVQLNRSSDYFHYEELDYGDYFDGIHPHYAENDANSFFFQQPSVLPRISHFLEDHESGRIDHIRTVENRSYFEKVNDDFAMLNETEFILANELALEYGLEPALFAPYIRSYYYTRNLQAPYAPGFLYDEQLLIMDHTNEWMFIHDQAGNAIDSIGIYHNDLMREDFIEMIQDPLSEKLYTHHKKGGVHYIRPFDVATGASGRPYQMDKPFAEKVKVYGGYVYYLYQTPIEEKAWHLLRDPLPF